jgi:hypothetical protein
MKIVLLAASVLAIGGCSSGIVSPDDHAWERDR